MLADYRIIEYNANSETISLNKFSKHLVDSHPQSISRAMYMIDKRWWKAAAHLRASCDTQKESSFELANGKSFYQTYILQNDPKFFNGMAAISLMEDKDVAGSIARDLEPFDTIVDIGGGDGGLLNELHHAYPDKKFVLYEKAPEREQQESHVEYVKRVENATNNLVEKLIEKHGGTFKPEVVLGDFNKEEHGVPRYQKAAYLMKCVLHNMSNEEVVVAVLTRVKNSMGESSKFYSAERLVDNDLNRPSFNLSSNLLMRLLFKANGRTSDFYHSCFQKVNLQSVNRWTPICANNYTVMVGDKLSLCSSNLLQATAGQTAEASPAQQASSESEERAVLS